VIAGYTPLDQLIWYYEELVNPEVDRILEKRLDTEKPSFGYGKLMERLLYFKSVNAPFYKKLVPIAETRLKQIDLQLEAPVVVIGDASYSMDVAIRVSTVIASVLTALCGAELKFFTGESVDPPVIPRTASEVIDVAFGVKADGLTAPAAALWPYYQAKKVVKFFIVVTDEIENEKYKGYYFPSLFQKYHKEVYPAKIVFVSFLENPSEKGRMVTALESMGIIPLQFRLDGKRPDLTKLDSLLGLLASESSFYPKQVSETTAQIRELGVTGVLAKIESKKDTCSNANNASQTVQVNSHASGKEEEGIETAKDKLQSLTVESNNLSQDLSMSSFLKDTVSISAENASAASKECVICEERKCDTALLECGHLNFCSTCASSLKECPICRKEVVRTVRIFQS